MNAAMHDTFVRKSVEWRSHKIARAVCEVERAQGAYQGPPRAFNDLAPHLQEIIIEMAARELAEEWSRL